MLIDPANTNAHRLNSKLRGAHRMWMSVCFALIGWGEQSESFAVPSDTIDHSNGVRTVVTVELGERDAY